MSWLEEIWMAIVLGFVQGFTEFLPISSTAHVFLIGDVFFNGKDVGLGTSNIIQMGSLFAAMYFFKKDLVEEFTQFVKIIATKKYRKLFIDDIKSWYYRKGEKSSDYKKNVLIAQVVIGTIPILAAASVFYSQIAEYSRDLSVIGIVLILGGILLYIAEKIGNNNLNSSFSTFSFRETWVIGFFQALAVIPGMSRSGSALTGALAIGENRDKAVKFSFILGIPILVLAGLKGLRDTFSATVNWSILPTEQSGEVVQLSILSLSISFVIAYISGYYFLKWLMKYLSKNSSNIFVIYRIVLGFIILYISFV